MTTATRYRQPADAKLKGWHVLLIMMAFFGVMFTVNGIFLYSAITSFPGEDVEKSYAQGLEYNAALEARRAQADLGWTIRAGLTGTNEETVAVDIETEKGEPVVRMDVQATLRRPVTAAGDIVLALQPDRLAAGRYVAPVPHDLDAGRWEMIIKATRASDNAVIEARKTVTVS